MEIAELHDLAQSFEETHQPDEGLERDAMAALRSRWSDAPSDLTRAGALRSTDAVLRLVQHFLPGWTMAIEGVADAAHGQWHCTLKPADKDDFDAFLRVGRGALLPYALAAALFSVLSVRGLR